MFYQLGFALRIAATSFCLFAKDKAESLTVLLRGNAIIII
jgi:hypothetical protein